ncbi:uncharacterized protein LOC101208810 isoform X2 [Cucumis sativus]|uniref:uncharacterized protein LOC101208810 isoform X2 n=1 Tax=Cucumis sativus TaxID=3659 RepID=UPI0002B4824D|nr:uncharacterized protein LOC101208810 isoform X2 [Cucumis sativus]KAE8650016.1 hypothetical protein Csa_010106 [Cucumis sativus]
MEDGREGLPPNPESTGVSATSATASHGIEVAVEFKPVEHPIEPLDNDQPIQCPLPEPSILNDGRIWKERVSSMRKLPDLPVMKEAEVGETRPRPTRTILPSISAPEHNILNLLEESGI